MNWTLLICEGHKARDLLHGQSSCDLLNVPAHTAVIGALCTPKGKAYATALFHVYSNTQVHMLLDTSLVATTQQQLQKYLPFFRCRLIVPEYVQYQYQEDVPHIPNKARPSGMFALAHTANGGYVLSLCEQGLQYLVSGSDQPDQSAGDTHTAPCQPSPLWQQRWLQAGYPLLTHASSERYTPNMLNFDKHSGVSFDKGCYTGQEAIARTYYRGQVKRRLYLATTTANDMPSILLDNSSPCGIWLDGVCVDGVWYGHAVVITSMQQAHTECGSEVTLTECVYAE